MAEPKWHSSKTKVLRNLFGTVLGMIVFLGFTQFIPQDIRAIACMILGFWIMLGTKNTYISTVLGMQMAVAGNISHGMIRIIFLRSVYVVVGGVFVLLCSWLSRQKETKIFLDKIADVSVWLVEARISNYDSNFNVPFHRETCIQIIRACILLEGNGAPFPDGSYAQDH